MVAASGAGANSGARGAVSCAPVAMPSWAKMVTGTGPAFSSKTTCVRSSDSPIAPVIAST